MVKNASAIAPAKLISHHIFAEVIENTATGQRSLHATIAFQEGAVISKFFAAEIFTTPNYLTVQTGIARHITLEPAFLQYINHSCHPNVFFDTRQMTLVAIRNIEPMDELCFFYPSTELEMAQPFLCFCGANNCLQNIKGALHISTSILKNYKLTPFIIEQLSIQTLLPES